MKYLYIFDIAARDGDFSNDNPNSTEVGRRVFLLTNSERAVTFSASAEYWFSYRSRPDAIPGFPGNTFFPVAGVSHSGVSLSGENNSGDISLTLPAAHEVAQLFMYDAPTAIVNLTVLAQPDAGSPSVLWAGQVDSCAFDSLLAKFKCSHASSILRRQGLTRKHPRSCGHVLYGPQPGCGVNHSQAAPFQYFSYREDGFVAEVRDGGMTLIVPEAANRAPGFFTEGFIAIAPEYGTDTAGVVTRHRPRAGFPFASDGPLAFVGGYRRHIVSQAGSELRLSAPVLAPLTAPVRVSVFAGCNLTPEVCTAKFANFVNFGGYPYIPIKNAFESGVKN